VWVAARRSPCSCPRRRSTSGPYACRVAPILESLEFQSQDLSGVRVLIVDDDADSRELIDHVLSECDAQVYAAWVQRPKAIALVQEHRPDVIVSDIGMPDVDGLS
jgi:response regulator RpfG family c-di-GMP phosphodiesterase